MPAEAPRNAAGVIDYGPVDNRLWLLKRHAFDLPGSRGTRFSDWWHYMRNNHAWTAVLLAHKDNSFSRPERVVTQFCCIGFSLMIASAVTASYADASERCDEHDSDGDGSYSVAFDPGEDDDPCQVVDDAFWVNAIVTALLTVPYSILLVKLAECGCVQRLDGKAGGTVKGAVEGVGHCLLCGFSCLTIMWIAVGIILIDGNTSYVLYTFLAGKAQSQVYLLLWCTLRFAMKRGGRRPMVPQEKGAGEQVAKPAGMAAVQMAPGPVNVAAPGPVVGQPQAPGPVVGQPPAAVLGQPQVSLGGVTLQVPRAVTDMAAHASTAMAGFSVPGAAHGAPAQVAGPPVPSAAPAAGAVVQTNCPNCGVLLQVQRGAPGQVFQCPQGHQFSV